jgi:hypothetical protein
MGRTADLLQTDQKLEIVVRGIQASAMAGAKAVDGVVHLTIPSACQRSTLERVWAAGGEVISVNPVRRSLEQLFLELTGSSGSSPKAPQ